MFGHRWDRYLTSRFGAPWIPPYVVYRVTRDVGVCALRGPGAPYAAIILEELAALGVRRFVIVGMAGSLQSDLESGRTVVCERALRDEGTSHHYGAVGRYARPSPGLTRALRATLDRNAIPYEVGATWTIDTPYRETLAEVRRYRSEGILTVEMEAAAVFTVARIRGCEAAALFVISDHLTDRKWEPRFHDTRPALRSGLDLAIATLSGRAASGEPRNEGRRHRRTPAPRSRPTGP